MPVFTAVLVLDVVLVLNKYRFIAAFGAVAYRSAAFALSAAKLPLCILYLRHCRKERAEDDWDEEPPEPPEKASGLASVKEKLQSLNWSSRVDLSPLLDDLARMESLEERRRVFFDENDLKNFEEPIRKIFADVEEEIAKDAHSTANYVIIGKWSEAKDRIQKNKEKNRERFESLQGLLSDLADYVSHKNLDSGSIEISIEACGRAIRSTFEEGERI